MFLENLLSSVTNSFAAYSGERFFKLNDLNILLLMVYRIVLLYFNKSSFLT